MSLDPVQRNLRTVTRFFTGTHTGDLSVIAETVAPAVTTHGFPAGRNPSNHDEYRAFFAGFGQAFANMTHRIDAMVADADHVSVRFTLSVDQVGPYLGAPASGQRVEFTGQVLYRLENGLIAETWLQIDEMALLRQIGALPAAA